MKLTIVLSNGDSIYTSVKDPVKFRTEFLGPSVFIKVESRNKTHWVRKSDISDFVIDQSEPAVQRVTY